MRVKKPKKLCIQKTKFELICVGNEPTQQLPLPHFCFILMTRVKLYFNLLLFFFSLKVTAGFGENAFHLHLRNTHHKR